MSRRTIGQQLKQARKASGLSQSDVAIKLSCARPRISLIETGRYQGSLQLLERYLNLMQLELCAQPISTQRPVFEDLERIYGE